MPAPKPRRHTLSRRTLLAFDAIRESGMRPVIFSHRTTAGSLDHSVGADH